MKGILMIIIVVPAGIAPSGQLARQNLDWEGLYRGNYLYRRHKTCEPLWIGLASDVQVTWFDIASKDFFREMFQTLRRRILIIKLTGKKIDAYHIVLQDTPLEARSMCKVQNNSSLWF
eukprot:scaffold10135_cov113-Skeletonema_dohrnii-CCMP3373.AAC.1